MKQYIVMARGDDGWVEPHVCRDYGAANQKVYDLYTGILETNINDNPDDEYSIERLNTLNKETDWGQSLYTAEFVSKQIDEGDLPDGCWFEIYAVPNNHPGFRIQ